MPVELAIEDGAINQLPRTFQRKIWETNLENKTQRNGPKTARPNAIDGMADPLRTACLRLYEPPEIPGP